MSLTTTLTENEPRFMRSPCGRMLTSLDSAENLMKLAPCLSTINSLIFGATPSKSVGTGNLKILVSLTNRVMSLICAISGECRFGIGGGGGILTSRRLLVEEMLPYLLAALSLNVMEF